jgi:hypothetical protein
MVAATYVPQQVIQRARTIAWADVMSAITAEALAERDELSTDVAQERLDETAKLGFLDKQTPLTGYSALYKPTAVGKELARRHVGAGGYSYPMGMRSAQIKIPTARHMIACASAAAALERRYPDHRVSGVRELYRDEREQKRRLASVEVRRNGVVGSHFPDMVIWPPSMPGESPRLPIGVEIELTIKSKKALVANLRAWARCPYIEVVLYYVETSRIEELLLARIEELKAEEMIVVNPLGEIISSLPGFEFPQSQADD